MEILRVFDTSNFLNNYETIHHSNILISTLIQNEIETTLGKSIYSVLSESSKISVLDPEDEYIEKAQQHLRSFNETNLSDADISVIALALQYEHQNPIVHTDDYAIQNILQLIDIKFQTLKTTGISRKRIYYYYCTACNHRMNFITDHCDNCGNRKVVRRYYTKK